MQISLCIKIQKSTFYFMLIPFDKEVVNLYVSLQQHDSWLMHYLCEKFCIALAPLSLLHKNCLFFHTIIIPTPTLIVIHNKFSVKKLTLLLSFVVLCKLCMIVFSFTFLYLHSSCQERHTKNNFIILSALLYLRLQGPASTKEENKHKPINEFLCKNEHFNATFIEWIFFFRCTKLHNYFLFYVSWLFSCLLRSKKKIVKIICIAKLLILGKCTMTTMKILKNKINVRQSQTA